MQAGAHVEAGLPAAGFTLIDESLALAGADGLLSPLFHIVRGDLSLLGPDASPAAAIESYERAYDVSARLGSRMTQLRAATRLMQAAPESDRVRRLESLRAIHSTINEGSETRDLKDAAELLAN
jgi:D-mannonate dehydratase